MRFLGWLIGAFLLLLCAGLLGSAAVLAAGPMLAGSFNGPFPHGAPMHVMWSGQGLSMTLYNWAILALPAVLLIGLPVATVAGVLVLAFSQRKQRPAEAEDTRLLQELHHRCGQMEARVEALETLLLQREEARAR